MAIIKSYCRVCLHSVQSHQVETWMQMHAGEVSSPLLLLFSPINHLLRLYILPWSLGRGTKPRFEPLECKSWLLYSVCKEVNASSQAAAAKYYSSTDASVLRSYCSNVIWNNISFLTVKTFNQSKGLNNFLITFNGILKEKRLVPKIMLLQKIL